MQIDDVIYLYLLVRFNNKTETYAKYRTFYDEYYANKVCARLNSKNEFPEKYSFHIIKYKLVKV